MQAAQRNSWRLVWCRVRLPGVDDRRSVRRDGRAPQVGVGFVGNHRPLAGVGVDSHQHRAQRCARRGLLPARDDEPAVGTDVEIGVAQRTSRCRGEVSGLVTGQIDTEHVGLCGPEVGVPVPNRIAGVHDRRDLVVLAQFAQPTVVVDVAGRRQLRPAHHRHIGVPRGAHRLDTAGQRQRLERLAARRGQAPQRRGRFVVVGARSHRQKQDVTAGGEHRRRLPLGAARQPPRRTPARRVDFPDRADVFGALVVELGDRRHDPRPVRQTPPGRKLAAARCSRRGHRRASSRPCPVSSTEM